MVGIIAIGETTATGVVAVDTEGVEGGETTATKVTEVDDGETGAEEAGADVGMTAVVVTEAVVSIETEMIAAGLAEEEETDETTGIVKEAVETLEEVETNGETKETGVETGAVTKETGVVTREAGVVVKVETGETSREVGTRATVGEAKDSGTKAPIRDMGNGTMLRLLDNKQQVSNNPGETSRATGHSNSSSSMPPISNTSSGTVSRLSRTTPPVGVGQAVPSRSLQDCVGSLLSVLFSLLGSSSLLCTYGRPILCCITWNL